MAIEKEQGAPLTTEVSDGEHGSQEEEKQETGFTRKCSSCDQLEHITAKYDYKANGSGGPAKGESVAGEDVRMGKHGQKHPVRRVLRLASCR